MTLASELIRTEKISRVYRTGEIEVHAVHEVDFTVHRGEFTAVAGPSGSGKSTLLNLVSGLDVPTTGRVLLAGRDISTLGGGELSDYRRDHVGFIFQSYNLIQQLNVLENIEMPLFYQGYSEGDSHEIAMGLAARVGLDDRVDHKPFELSGGQQQRVAIARALAVDPIIILADEPTGNLDSKSGAEILNLFDELHDQGKTLIMVTHSDEMAERSQRLVCLRDGLVESDDRRNA